MKDPYTELLDAVRIINKLNNIGDGVYEVKNRLDDNDLKNFKGGTWEHPKVIQYGEAVMVVNQHLQKP
jgi:hypothetical protein